MEKVLQNGSNEVQYRRAKNWQIALSQLNGGANMAFFILLGMVSYLANAGYGIAVVTAGIIITATRVADGITDPIIALIIDKMNFKFGKIRLLLLIGWLIESLSVLMLFVWGSNGNHGIIFFIVMYMVYIIGYTINSVTGNIIAPVMTNDPKQRPIVNVWSTAYAYLFPMLVNIVITMVILPRFGNQYTVQMLAGSCIFCVVVALILNLLACIGVSEVDRPESFQGITANGKADKVTVRDMARLLKVNRPLQLFIVSAASDKLAQQTGSQAVVSTMLFGILIGNMQLGTMVTMIAMLPSIIFAILGARHAGKVGNKNAMVIWTRASIAIACVSIVYCAVSDLQKITVAIIPTVIFFVLQLALNGTKMCVSTATSSMRADIIDYELKRSGKYLPGAVSATYSFVDKCVSALGATVATACIALIGYRSTMPQPTDNATMPIFIMTMVLYYGLPVIGWVCTLLAMKFYPLTKEEMVEVQKDIQAKKQAAMEMTA